MKLKFEFSAELPIKESPRDIASMTGLFPRAGRRACAFGWVVGDARPERYWMADVGAEGVRHRVLPHAVTERFIALTSRSPSSSGSHLYIQAFGFGEGMGLLLGNRHLLLFRDILAEPQEIGIEAGDGLADTRGADGQLVHYALGCGHARDGVVPVVFSGAGAGQGEPRHLALLQVDADAGRACWSGTLDQGLPPTPRLERTIFSDPRERMFPGVDLGTGSPLIQACAHADGQWLLYLGGLSRAHFRFGLAPSLLTRFGPDLATHQPLFQAREDSFGRLCASGDRLILSPLRNNGAAKGKQAIYQIADGLEVTPTLPRGFSKHSIVEYDDGSYWLLPMPWGYQHSPLVCCSVGVKG